MTPGIIEKNLDFLYMKAHEIPENDRKCINCAYYGMYVGSCIHPEMIFPPINYDDPVCVHFETKELYELEKK